MFCPLTKRDCFDDCACNHEGDCSFANALCAFECIDPCNLANAVDYIASLNERENVDLYINVQGSVTAYSE